MFSVEGRYFPNGLYAFTFASIQADRMDRPVEVHVDRTDQGQNQYYRPKQGKRANPTWHATAQPSNFVRRHLVKEGIPQ